MSSVRIICLHRVVPDDERERYWPWLLRGSAVTDRELHQKLSTVTASHDWVDEQAAWEIILGKQQRSRPSCWVTFDDGYHDNLSTAAPILQQFGIRPTLFVSTRVLQPEFLLPVDRWYLTLLAARRNGVRVDLGDGEWCVDLSDWESRVRMVSGPEKQRYVQASPESQTAIANELQNALDAPALTATLRDRARYLTERELLELSAIGWRIGHHGASHRLLTSLDADDMLTEVLEPARTLCRIPVHRSRFMAWPDGAWTPEAATRIADLLEPVGYVGGLTIEPRLATSRDDTWALPRFIDL